jgi:hypothetical protein
LKDFVKVLGDTDFVVEEVLKPNESEPLGHGDQRQKVTESNANVGGWGIDFRRLYVVVQTKSKRHPDSSLRRAATAVMPRVAWSIWPL